MRREFSVVVLTAVLVAASEAALRSAETTEVPVAPPTLTIEDLEKLPKLPADLGPLPPVPVPADNPQSEAKVELGRRLFFEKRLSREKTQSCASCHDAGKAFCDRLPRSLGFHDKEMTRNAPTILNAAYNTFQFWDGRATTLEDQAGRPMLSPGEMNMTREEVVARLSEVPDYKQRFHAAFGGNALTFDQVTKALAAFERVLVTGDSPFDRYARGDRRALSEREKRGLALFVGKAACTQCHKGPNFTDDKFHRIGVKIAEGRTPDSGRFAVTGKQEDHGAFKTPGLRNVAQTAPYMHDGRLATLEETIDLYDRGGEGLPGQTSLIFKLNLTKDEKADLLAFMKALTGPQPVIRTR